MLKTIDTLDTKQMILLIDNYDSFTYNLVHYLYELGQEVKVVRNDAVSLEEIHQMAPSHILISPGPGTPSESGICNDVIKEFAGKIPIFGVCLGHQAIGEAFGGKVIRARQPMHGKISAVENLGGILFGDLPKQFNATRYHSLVIDPETLPDCLEVTARTADGTIMAVSHKTLPVYGVQFHPESIASEFGHNILNNFLKCQSLENT